ncbi:initiator tRNA phosphoribosyl transferase-domain-containing protein [Mycena polygramma]|nr:initiator tRNA phosphoribosyl transferase-domain-containing protein [Mycena polygramma]
MFNAQREQSDALAFLRKESLDLFNRLHSIAEDVAFVNQVHAAYPNIPILRASLPLRLRLPLKLEAEARAYIANLRCGAWYTDPAISTDGHFSNWSFNLRRPNLHLLPLAAAHGGKGIVLVDSTRAGKRVPDALAKTVPIWCAVVNRAVSQRFPEKKEAEQGWDDALYTPPGAVSAQEHAQIARRVEGWADALAASSYALPDLPRPLRPAPASGGLPVPPARDAGTPSQSATSTAMRAVPDAFTPPSSSSFPFRPTIVLLTHPFFLDSRRVISQQSYALLVTALRRPVTMRCVNTSSLPLSFTWSPPPTPLQRCARIHARIAACTRTTGIERGALLAGRLRCLRKSRRWRAEIEHLRKVRARHRTASERWAGCAHAVGMDSHRAQLGSRP